MSASHSVGYRVCERNGSFVEPGGGGGVCAVHSVSPVAQRWSFGISGRVGL